jgi:hypothetical protein
MASAVTSQIVSGTLAFETFFHDPDSASAVPVTSDGGTTKYWRDMKDFGWFAVSACNTTLTGNGITDIAIYAADDNTGTHATLIVDSGTLSGTAVGNGGFVECTALQIREVSAANSRNFRYVTAYITVANSADEAAVAFIRGAARHPQLNLTAATF